MVDGPSTSTLEAARAHARAQAEAATTAGPTVPATAATDLPDGVDPGQVVWDERIAGGGYASHALPRGSVLRLTDEEGDACVQLVAFVGARPWERLNVADTVKVQWQAHLGPGALLLSDMGRVLLTLVDDTSARHDCLCGGTNRAGATARWGDGSVGGPTPCARDLLVVGATKHGLDRRDVATPVNLFKGVQVDPDGALHLNGSVRPGTHVELRAELDVVVVLANTPHPLDDRPAYTATPVRATAWRVEPPEVDPLREATPERARAFANTDELLRSAR